MSNDSPSTNALATEIALSTGAMSRLLGHAAGHGRSVTAWRVLSGLDTNGPQRVGDLAVQQRVAQPTMTGLVIRLENDGMVQRQPDPMDGRASLVLLTERGAIEVGNYRLRAIAALTDGIDSFDDQERDTLAQAIPLLQRLAQQVAANLDK